MRQWTLFLTLSMTLAAPPCVVAAPASEWPGDSTKNTTVAPVYACGRGLVQFITKNRLNRYLLKVAWNKLLSGSNALGMEMESVTSIVSPEDIVNDIFQQILDGTIQFQMNWHDDKKNLAEIEENNHLRAFLAQRVRWRAANYLKLLYKEGLKRPLYDDSGKMIVVADQRALTPAEQMELNLRPGDPIESDISLHSDKTGLSQKSWEQLNDPKKLVEAVTKVAPQYRIRVKEFFAASGGQFTAGDISEMLISNAIDWNHRFGDKLPKNLMTETQIAQGTINRERALDTIREMTIRQMCEDITGAAMVRDRTIAYLELTSPTAAEHYKMFVLEGHPTDLLLEDPEWANKARISYRKQAALETFDKTAQRIMEYPIDISVERGGKTVLLSDSEVAALIHAFEEVLRKTSYSEVGKAYSRSILMNDYVSTLSTAWKTEESFLVFVRSSRGKKSIDQSLKTRQRTPGRDNRLAS